MYDLIAEFIWQQASFVNGDTCWRTGTGDQHVGNHAWIVEVPVSLWNLWFPVRAFDLPSCTVRLIGVTIVAELHHEIDARGSVAVIVVVGLPQSSEGID